MRRKRMMIPSFVGIICLNPDKEGGFVFESKGRETTLGSLSEMKGSNPSS